MRGMNVTEKVARAEAERRQVDESDHTIDYDMEVDAFVAGALWQAERLSDPEVLASPEVVRGIAGVLAEHPDFYFRDAFPGDRWFVCEGCGDEIETHPPAVRGEFVHHQAAAVVEWLRGRAL